MECNVVWARRNNIPEKKITEIDDYSNSDAFTGREKAVFMLADTMALKSEGEMPKETLAALREHFTDDQIVELGTYFGLVTGFQRFNTVFRILYRRED